MSKPIEITRLDLSASGLRELAGRTRDGAVVRRLLGIALILEGHSREEAARLSGMDRQTLRDWAHRYNADGVAGLSSRCSPGRPPALSEAQMEELRSLVLEGPDLERNTVNCNGQDARRIALGTAVEVQRESVDPRGLNIDPIGACQAGVDGRQRAGSQSVELDPICGSVLVTARAVADPFREAFPFVAGEPVEDGRIAIRVFPSVVLHGGILRVFDADSGFLKLIPQLSH